MNTHDLPDCPFCGIGTGKLQEDNIYKCDICGKVFYLPHPIRRFIEGETDDFVIHKGIHHVD